LAAGHLTRGAPEPQAEREKLGRPDILNYRVGRRDPPEDFEALTAMGVPAISPPEPRCPAPPSRFWSGSTNAWAKCSPATD